MHVVVKTVCNWFGINFVALETCEDQRIDLMG